MSDNIIETLVDSSIDSLKLLCKISKPFFRWLFDGYLPEEKPDFDILWKELKVKNSIDNYPILFKENNGYYSKTYMFTIPYGLCIDDFIYNKNRIAQFLKCDIKNIRIELVNGLVAITIYDLSKLSFDYQDYKFDYNTKELRVPLGIDLKTYAPVYWRPCENTNAHAGIYGATGSGKSVCLNTILYYLCQRKDVDIYLNDTKCSDLFLFEKYAESYTDGTDYIEETASLIVDLMNKRYELLKSKHCRNINELKKDKPNYIFFVIEEFSSFNVKEYPDLFKSLDLILSKGRAAGVFVIIVSQTVYSTLLPGNLKSNISTSICFRQKTQEASKVTTGDYMKAVSLRGQGHGLLITNEEIEFQSFYIHDDIIKSLK